MDLKGLINSELIEQYVLGLTSEKDSKAVQCLSSIYPEIKEEITSLQLVFEKLAADQAINPPEYLKSKIMNVIENEKQIGIDTVPILAITHNNNIVKKETNKINYYLVAASVLIILFSGFLYVSVKNQNIVLDQSIAKLEKEKTLKNEQLMSQINLVENQKLIQSILTDKNTVKIELNSVKQTPDKVNVYWNKTQSQLVFKSENLNKLNENQQYQLWAIVNGEPTDMGVLESELIQNNSIVLIKNINNPQAFAITIEPKGGSKTPTLAAMVVLGKV